MDSFGDDSQPTQATQTVVDPRRLGQQNSGFSDTDIADIICLLVPQSSAARREIRRLAIKTPEYTVGRDEALNLDVEGDGGDMMGGHDLPGTGAGEHHVALRFSAEIKNPVNGFTFGRNESRCDIVFEDDPMRRLSNSHFRIYLNEHGVLMIEDMSTNGTVVDEQLLRRKGEPPLDVKRTLRSGSNIKILMHEEQRDLKFRVWIPIRHGFSNEAYKRNLRTYIANRAALTVDLNATIVPGPGGRVDIFKPTVPRADPSPRHPVNNLVAVRRVQGGPAAHHDADDIFDGIPTAWGGSSKYNRVGEVGRGAFATVYKVTSVFTGEPYAAKELDKRKFMKNGVLDQKVENEMRIMQKVKHPNIVQYVEHLDWDNRLLIIIMEYVGKGDLGKMISQYGPLTEDTTKIMAGQLLSALDYLHKMNITHRDVKPDNILVSSHDPFVVKLTDFGLSKMIDHEQTFLRTFCGTLLYCAPEVYSEYAEYDSRGRRHPRNRRLRPQTGQRYDHAVDIWSLGGVLFYSMTKSPPFPAQSGASHSALLHQIMTKPLNTAPLEQAQISEDGVEFLQGMLDRKPETRATIESLQNHPWIRPPAPQRPNDDISDHELSFNASQLSIQDQELQMRLEDDLIPASDDEELLDQEPVQIGGYDSEKENYTFGAGNQPQPQPQRLFGEVNPSAVGSQGVAAHRLNLPVSKDSFASSASTEILGADIEIKDSFESEQHSTPRQKNHFSQAPSVSLEEGSFSLSRSRSVEDLNTKTFDMASQSLGGAESQLENLNMKSRAGSLFASRGNEMNSSKRKQDSSSEDEAERVPVANGRGLKRFRSDPSTVQQQQQVAVRTLDKKDFDLMSQVPSIARQSVQIDIPVHKSTYWLASDRSTWHLGYPEMTQLQFDAFKTAAKARGEDFAPGKTSLWDLAMKYFPPTNRERPGKAKRTFEDSGDHTMPSTAIESQSSQPVEIPDTQDAFTTMAMHSERMKPVVACFKSTPSSVVHFIQVLVTECMISWGRATDNTRSYEPKSESRVPKYAFKLLLWKNNYDATINRNWRPWNKRIEPDEDQFMFYICTKATNGIWINGEPVRSYLNEQKRSDGPYKYWVPLYDGDRISVWQTLNGESKTELTFRCVWGGSAKPRPSYGHQAIPTLVDTDTANRLDQLCDKIERKMRSLNEHDLCMEEAEYDANERHKHIEREREKSRQFEKLRRQADRGGRRPSPMPGITYGDSSSTPAMWTSQFRGGPPVFRRPSPTASELLRAARY
ncbi:putative serine/threonine-protein kinase [Triangularia verruculosa]|uniref:Autophagy-related protein 1 n=1 Tax=Triangularia verruculosa TaxID=2587418 RepID=A0AAN6XIH7_9PEZI|nr:putative serine/threonine-protein kinase [Triangularia verruculosa]